MAKRSKPRGVKAAQTPKRRAAASKAVQRRERRWARRRGRRTGAKLRKRASAALLPVKLPRQANVALPHTRPKGSKAPRDRRCRLDKSEPELAVSLPRPSDEPAPE